MQVLQGAVRVSRGAGRCLWSSDKHGNECRQRSGEEQGVMANINTTPLVDVMLVLLIIFLITIPVITKTVPVELPKAVNIPTQTKPENITIAVDTAGNIYWNESRSRTASSCLTHDRAAGGQDAAARDAHPRRPGGAVRGIGRVLYELQRGGMVKVGFHHRARSIALPVGARLALRSPEACQ